MQKIVCPECREVVVDHAAGDTVCTECGLAHFRGNGSQGDFAALGSGSGRITAPTPTELSSFKTIGTMADRLGLVSTIKDRADEIYKKVEDMMSIRGKRQDAILAACLYVACRQEDKPRTFKEIHSVAIGATIKEIGRATNFIVKRLEEEMGNSMSPMGSIHAGDFLRRFCSHLGMSNQAVLAATETVKKAEELDISNSPISIAAAAIYMISLLEDKKPLKDISRVAGLAEDTVKASYNYLCPHAEGLVPEWFCNPDDLKRLLAP